MLDGLEVDIPCDPTQVDDTGLPWMFLDESANPQRVVVGATVAASRFSRATRWIGWKPDEYGADLLAVQCGSGHCHPARYRQLCIHSHSRTASASVVGRYTTERPATVATNFELSEESCTSSRISPWPGGSSAAHSLGIQSAAVPFASSVVQFRPSTLARSRTPQCVPASSE